MIEEGLREAGLADIVLLTERHGLVARIAAAEPDVILLTAVAQSSSCGLALSWM